MPVIASAEDSGVMVAMKGSTLILRDAKTINAAIKDRILLKDIVETRESSKAKMLFSDESILTLSENSRISIKEYLYSEDRKSNRSVFNLIDGKLKSLVGKTEFEVHTPTMVVAARGTYFITWVGLEEGIPVSEVSVLEGKVSVYNINPAIAGVVTLERGTMSKVYQNRPPTPPAPIIQPVQKEAIAPVIETKKELPMTPPIEQQAPSSTTPVHIRIPIPEGI